MVQRYNPDYVMHAARFAPFAREAEHGEFVKFSEYEALVSELATSQQINTQTLQVKLTMAETIKELTDRVNALAVENACLVRAINDHKNSTHFCERCGEDDLCATDDVCSVLRGIPDTDSAIAAFEAQGVEKFADELHKTAMAICSVKPDNTTPGAYAGLARTFAKKLRDAK
ncbi:TPA: hypothetical protein ACXE51_002139 [Serratia marcescens]|uniref:hypothetical protein n=1 Tax=Serratia TaxID=613 RepID=UPI001C1E58AA|nr:hypothetical protein [Serratia ureilytica]QWU34863.1 hypothetical protein KQJ82_18925 [Serratia ureilytica]